MSITVRAQNIILIQNAKRLNEQYHIYAAHCGLSDPAFSILYTLHYTEETVTQNELAVMWCYPKQTINFAVSGLVKKGYVRLEQLSGARNSKAVRLTEEGRSACREILGPLTEAEERSLLMLTEQEREMLVMLEEKQCSCFGEELKKIMRENDKK